MQKKYYLCCPIFNIYDIVYFMKRIANTKSHTEAYGRAASNATRCILGVYPPPPPVNTYLHFRSNDIYRRQYSPCGFRRVFGCVGMAGINIRNQEFTTNILHILIKNIVLWKIKRKSKFKRI